MKQADFVYKDELVSAVVNSFFVGKNPGHVIVVPSKHHENIYELPDATAHRVIETVKRVALAMKQAYDCDGIMTRQNNEPASAQHAFHYHHHIFPRYDNDGFDEISQPKEKYLAEPSERAKYAEELKKFLQ